MGNVRARVLIVDDDASVREALEIALAGEGYQVRAEADGSRIERVAEQFRPDVAVLDVRLPTGPDGYTISRRLRSIGDIPVLFLTAAAHTPDARLEGFRAGADDLLAKPFSVAELLARIDVVLRRRGRTAPTVWEIGDVVVDAQANKAFRGGAPVELTATERQLLVALARHPGQVLSKEQLLFQVWGYDACNQNLVEVHVSSLRRKLEELGPRVVHTVRGAGYVLRVPPAAEGAPPPATADPGTARRHRPQPDPPEDAGAIADLVRASGIAVVGARPDGTVWFWNAAAERLYGRSADATAGQPVVMLVAPEQRDAWASWFQSACGGRTVADRPAVHVDNRERHLPVRVTLAPVRNDGGAVTGVSITVQPRGDGGARTEHDAHAGAGTEDADAQAGETQVRERRFLADAAHQLRTPVTAIQACAETLLRGPDQAQRDKLLANLVREAARTSKLLADLLTLARLDEGRPSRPDDVDLVAVCGDELDRMWSLAPHLDVVLSAPEQEVLVAADEAGVRDVLANLLDNARRHAAARVQLDVGSDDEGVTVRIVDDGPGLPPATAETAFDRFVSLDGMGGSGLGLAIARELARAQGGDVSYEGGAFVVRLAPLRSSGAAR